MPGCGAGGGRVVEARDDLVEQGAALGERDRVGRALLVGVGRPDRRRSVPAVSGLQLGRLRRHDVPLGRSDARPAAPGGRPLRTTRPRQLLPRVQQVAGDERRRRDRVPAQVRPGGGRRRPSRRRGARPGEHRGRRREVLRRALGAGGSARRGACRLPAAKHARCRRPPRSSSGGGRDGRSVRRPARPRRREVREPRRRRRRRRAADRESADRIAARAPAGAARGRRLARAPDVRAVRRRAATTRSRTAVRRPAASRAAYVRAQPVEVRPRGGDRAGLGQLRRCRGRAGCGTGCRRGRRRGPGSCTTCRSAGVAATPARPGCAWRRRSARRRGVDDGLGRTVRAGATIVRPGRGADRLQPSQPATTSCR